MRRLEVAACLLLLLGCGGEEGTTASAGPGAALPAPGEDPAGTVSASVRIEAEEEALLFGAGRILEVAVEEGDTVRAGSLLVGLSGDRAAAGVLSASLESVEVAGIDAINALREHERCLALFEAGALSAAQLQGAETAMIAAEAALEAARAGVSGAVSIRSASSVQAPFDGIVGRVWAREGDLAGEEPLLLLTGGGGHVARALLPEREIGRITPGDSALFTTSALPGLTFRGVVATVATAIDPVTCLLPVTVRLSDPDSQLTSGLYGTLELGSDLKPDSY